MSSNLFKRIFTSVILISILILMCFYSFILIISLIIIGVIAWIEFYAIISKIFPNNQTKYKVIKFISRSISLIYIMSLFFLIIVANSQNHQIELYILYSALVAIVSDIGGLIIGKTFKGKKLTKISPNKTIYGSLGSFIFSLTLVPIFNENYIQSNFLSLIIITLTISLISQIGDLFISLLKRKAKVKDTSDILPGHGGILDRIDGIIFAIPIGVILFTI
tara:strand:- start:226 stop:885 length:660 start_codon:yes stop_codon:yes gene_type:complete